VEWSRHADVWLVATRQSATVADVIRRQQLGARCCRGRECGITETEDSWRMLANFSNGRNAAVALGAEGSVGRMPCNSRGSRLFNGNGYNEGLEAI
jgi:hypothetical protein